MDGEVIGGKGQHREWGDGEEIPHHEEHDCETTQVDKEC